MTRAEALARALAELPVDPPPAASSTPTTPTAAEPVTTAPAADDDAITVTEAGRLLAETRQSVDRRIRLGQLTAHEDETGRRWLSRREVMAFEKPDFRRRPRSADAATGALRAKLADPTSLADVVGAIERLSDEVRGLRTLLVMERV